MTKMTIKTYHELILLPTFEERFEYLKSKSRVGDKTFGGHRCLNQLLYRQSPEWRSVRREVILRDNGFDLAHADYPIFGPIYVHHINPITIEDIIDRKDSVLDPNNLICCSFPTHNAIHYGTFETINKAPIVRVKNDTCPWR